MPLLGSGRGLQLVLQRRRPLPHAFAQLGDGGVGGLGQLRVLRGKDRIPVYDGGFHTLRRFTEDVTEVRNGLECGIKLGDFNDYEENDLIECYELEKIPQTL